MKTQIICSLFISGCVIPSYSHTRPYIDATQNSCAKVHCLNMGEVAWSDGFWKDRFDMVIPNVIPAQYDYFMGFSEYNFRIVGDKADPKNGFRGTHWQDGDYYKWLEAQVAVYSVTKDPVLLDLIEEKAALLARSVADDGYITTHTQIGFGLLSEKKKYKNTKRFIAPNQHETYNMGHFLTLATTHYRVTGRRTLIDAAIKVGNFLDSYFKVMTPELTDIDYNPTQIMGLMELYRCTGDKRYMDCANRFISARGQKNGRTENQNDTKLRSEKRAVGHAVLAPVLYIGAADYVAESGDTVLLGALKNIWEDMYLRKASFTGGLGNVHGGPSEKNRNEVIHEAFGYPYHIHSASAYNETCATFYGAYFSWRMFMLTGEVKYLDTMEKAFYNNLSSMGLDGKSYFYTNVLRWHADNHYMLSMDYHNRWTTECACVCCPTSLARFLAETKEYAYAKNDDALYVTLYGSNNIETSIKGQNVAFSQSTDYPWNGNIRMTYKGDKNADFILKLRIPEWADQPQVMVNNESVETQAGTFASVARKWRKGDVVEISLNMKPQIVEANPMVEELRNQVAVSCGPLVYCAEAVDLPNGVEMKDVIIPSDAEFIEKFDKALLGGVRTLTTEALVRKSSFDENNLYSPLKRGYDDFTLKLIPYYAWANRGECEMTVFFPLRW